MIHIEIKKDNQIILSKNCEEKDFQIEEKRNITALYFGKMNDHPSNHVAEMCPSAKSRTIITINSFEIPNTFFYTMNDPEEVRLTSHSDDYKELLNFLTPPPSEQTNSKEKQ
jgi:hypothetical protein